MLLVSDWILLTTQIVSSKKLILKEPTQKNPIVYRLEKKKHIWLSENKKTLMENPKAIAYNLARPLN